MLSALYSLALGLRLLLGAHAPHHHPPDPWHVLECQERNDTPDCD